MEEPSGKVCRTHACGKPVVSTQAGALPQSYPAPESFPRSEPETTERYIVIIIDDDINNLSLKLSGIQMRPGTGEVCALMPEVVSLQSQPQVLTLTCGSHGPSAILGKEDNTQPQRTVHGSGTYPGTAQEPQNEHRVEERDSEGGELGRRACGRGLSRLVPSACAVTPPRAAPLRPVSSGQLCYYLMMTSFISPPVYFRICYI